jgi:hypothetical protein
VTTTTTTTSVSASTTVDQSQPATTMTSLPQATPPADETVSTSTLVAPAAPAVPSDGGGSDTQSSSFGSADAGATPWAAASEGDAAVPAHHATALTSDAPSLSIFVAALSVLFAGVAIAVHTALRLRRPTRP